MTNELKNLVARFENLRASPFGPLHDCGVYGVFVFNIDRKKSDKLLYIGSSKNIFKRLMSSNHIYRKAADRFSSPLYVYTKSLHIKNYIEAEKILIKHYRPFLNKIGK